MRKLSDYCSDDFKSYMKQFSVQVIDNPATLTEYIGNVNMLCEYCHKDFLDIGYDNARQYIDFLTGRYHNRQISRKTIYSRLSEYNTIAQYVEDTFSETGYTNPFKLIKRPEIDWNDIDPKRIPSMNQMDEVMSKAMESGIQTYAMFALATRACMTKSDILHLKRDYIVKEEGRTYLHYPAKKKSGNDRYIPLPKDLAVIVDEFNDYCIPNEDGYMFLNESGNTLSERMAEYTIAKLIESCDFDEHFTLKDFRNRGILDMAANGATAKQISEYTGLKDLRVYGFLEAKELVKDDCPADLVHYTLKPFNRS